MINEGQYDPMECESTSVMHSFNGSFTAYRWLLDQEEYLIDFEQIRVLGTANIAAALTCSRQLNASQCLEAVIARGSNLNDPAGDWALVHRAICYLPYVADIADFPNRIKVLWNAGADFHDPFKLDNDFGTTLDALFMAATATILYGVTKFGEYKRYGSEQISIPTPPLMFMEDVIEYDRLEDASDVKYRSRTSKSLWSTWYPGNMLSMLEVAQRYFDAWMEILLEAGLDIADYGRQEEQLHPEGLLHSDQGEARVHFEYGDHVSGCRIHVTEMWLYGLDETTATSAETSAMLCSWDFDDWRDCFRTQHEGAEMP